MNRIFQISVVFLVLISCDKDEVNALIPENEKSEFISAVDISSYPEIINYNPAFFDLEGNRKDFLAILKENGVNTIRLRLWVNPTNEHSGFKEVMQFSKDLKAQGFKIWLTLHYSDTWADPAHQIPPKQWQDLNYVQLKDSVYNYTEKVMCEIQPDYVQIGNEVNPGFLHPYGHITNHFEQFIELMENAIGAVRTSSTNAKIIMHIAGTESADWFFNQIRSLDYDIIGLSYYPLWHGKSVTHLKNTMKELSENYKKKILIAETAYPFTLEWDDWTDNIVGSDEQLILPEYPATAEGQQKFIKEIVGLTLDLQQGIGFCYWGAELIAWKGNQSTDASPWENQALFDFNNKALPVLEEFKIE